MLTLEETIDAISAIDTTPAIIKEASKRIAGVEFDENLRDRPATALAGHILRTYNKKTDIRTLAEAGIELAAIILGNIVKPSCAEDVPDTIHRIFNTRFYEIVYLRLLNELEQNPNLPLEEAKKKTEAILSLQDRMNEIYPKKEKGNT